MSNNFDGPVLLDSATDYFGFGRSGAASTGPRVYAVTADPSGVLTAPLGSLALRSTGGPGLYVNTDGGTTWALSGALGPGVSNGMRIQGLATGAGPNKTTQVFVGDGWAEADDGSGVILEYSNLYGYLNPITVSVSGVNGLDTGVIAQGGYYIWLIGNADGSTVNGLCSLSSTAPTMPTGYTRKRLVGWFPYTGASVLDFVTYAQGTAAKFFYWEAQSGRQILNAIGAGQQTGLTNVPVQTGGGTPLVPDSVQVCPTICAVLEKTGADSAFITGSGTSGFDTYGVAAGQRTSYEVVQPGTGAPRIAYRATGTTALAETNLWIDGFIFDRSGRFL